MKLKKSDTVLIISGDDRAKKGKIIKVIPSKQKIVVEGVSIQRRHQRPKKEGEKGQIVEKPAPISASNAKLICPRCQKPTMISRKIMQNKKRRVCKKCNQMID